MIHYVADFETHAHFDDVTDIWAYALVNIFDNDDSFEFGNNLDDFMQRCQDIALNKVVWFHNLKFDGHFIMDWLFRQGYRFKNYGRYQKKQSRTFDCLISEMGQFYSITVYHKVEGKKIYKTTFQDSFKKLPFSVDAIGKAFDCEHGKVEVDEEFYTRHREPDHELTTFEINYIKQDVLTVKDALKILLGEGNKRMTASSDALNNYKERLKMKGYDFKSLYPVLDLDTDDIIRHSYRGGFTYLNPDYKNKDVGQGVVYDVNSMYPSIMYMNNLPYGEPVYFDGRYEQDDDYPLYVQCIRCTFMLKENMIPTLQIKDNPNFKATEYVKSSKDEIVDLTMTNVDLDLFFQHYDVTVLEWNGGYKFKQSNTLFKDYIDYWYHIKKTTSGAQKQLAKLMLNSLYGKFASSPRNVSKLPYFEDGRVQFDYGDEEEGSPIYTAVASFVTSYARAYIIRSAQATGDRFIYADTDSLHLIGLWEPSIDIDPERLGAWDHESTFIGGKFIRAKTYLELFEGGRSVKCAGMPDNVKQTVDYDNFKEGATFFGKKVPKVVQGGVILEKRTFQIKEGV